MAVAMAGGGDKWRRGLPASHLDRDHLELEDERRAGRDVLAPRLVGPAGVAVRELGRNGQQPAQRGAAQQARGSTKRARAHEAPREERTTCLRRP